MKQYLDLLRHVNEKGVIKTDRTGTGTKSVFGYQMRFDLSRDFPLLTTKKMAIRALTHELLWFLKGDSNLRYLVENNVHLWDEWPFKAYLIQTGKPVPVVHSGEWNTEIAEFVECVRADDEFAKKYGSLGPIYGYQWRSWPTPDGRHIDQISEMIRQIKETPDSRRMVVSAWNVADIDEMAKAGLPPCHCLFQFYVAEGKLSCQLYQRSCDSFLGIPLNIASYSLLTLMMAQVCNLEPGEFVWTGGDVHIYSNHADQVMLQLTREPLPLPTMKLNPKVRNIFDFTIEDITLQDYQCYDAIKAPIAV